MADSDEEKRAIRDQLAAVLLEPKRIKNNSEVSGVLLETMPNYFMSKAAKGPTQAVGPCYYAVLSV
jgi:hypothetical protein